MKLAFDTSVVVASVLESHPHHPRTVPWLRAIAAGRVEASISLHAAAETWAVLTRLPPPHRVPPSTAILVLDRVLETFRPTPIAEDHYRAAWRRCAERSVASGGLFDALHLVVAESLDAAGLVTFNPRDFERLQREGATRIVVPPDPPGFDLEE